MQKIMRSTFGRLFNKNYLLMAATVCGISLAAASCSSNDDNPATPDLGVKEKIIGKWIRSEGDGQPVLTNNKMVYTFVSTTKAYVSTALNARQDMSTLWANQMEVAVAIDGNEVTVTNHIDDHTTAVEEYTVTAIDGSEFTARLKVSATVDGTVVMNEEHIMRYAKVTADYSAAILGLWECQGITGGETNNDDNARLEFLADGTYRFYRRSDAGFWSLVPRECNEYFVDGNLLCTRWQAAGEQMSYEWWEIASAADGHMQWTALRQNADGTTFQQGVSWITATPRTVLAGMDATGVILYGDVAYNYTYDADHRLTRIYEVTLSDNYVVRDINFAYSDGHISITGITDGYDLTAECSLDAQGRMTEMTRSAVSTTTGFTSNRTFTYTYDADGHMVTTTQISEGDELTHTFVWENGELVSVFTGEGTGNGDMVLSFETSDAPAQALFYLMKYDGDVSELCQQGCFGTLPVHMPSTRSLTVYMYGNPIPTSTSEYVYTVENGRLATCQDNEGSTHTFRWGVVKK